MPIVMQAWIFEEGGTGSSSAASAIGPAVLLASFCPPTCQPAAMAASSYYCSEERMSHTAFELEDAMAGVVQIGERERRMAVQPAK